MPKIKAETIDEYIKAAPGEAQAMLKALHSLLKEVAPEAKEVIKWGNPVFEEKRILFAFSAFKKHVNFMPTRKTLVHFTKELEGYETGKDTIQLPYDQPLPRELIRKIAIHRANDVRDNDAKWM